MGTIGNIYEHVRSRAKTLNANALNPSQTMMFELFEFEVRSSFVKAMLGPMLAAEECFRGASDLSRTSGAAGSTRGTACGPQALAPPAGTAYAYSSSANVPGEVSIGFCRFLWVF